MRICSLPLWARSSNRSTFCSGPGPRRAKFARNVLAVGGELLGVEVHRFADERLLALANLVIGERFDNFQAAENALLDVALVAAEDAQRRDQPECRAQIPCSPETAAR